MADRKACLAQDLLWRLEAFAYESSHDRRPRACPSTRCLRTSAPGSCRRLWGPLFMSSHRVAVDQSGGSPFPQASDAVRSTLAGCMSSGGHPRPLALMGVPDPEEKYHRRPTSRGVWSVAERPGPIAADRGRRCSSPAISPISRSWPRRSSTRRALPHHLPGGQQPLCRRAHQGRAAALRREISRPRGRRRARDAGARSAAAKGWPCWSTRSSTAGSPRPSSAHGPHRAGSVALALKFDRRATHVACSASTRPASGWSSTRRSGWPAPKTAPPTSKPAFGGSTPSSRRRCANAP